MSTKEYLIEEILKYQPIPLIGEDFRVSHSLIEKYGYLYAGIGESWEWFDNRKMYQGKSRYFPNAEKGHYFLQDAPIEELKQLLNILEK